MNTGPANTATPSTLPMHIARAYQLAPRTASVRPAVESPELNAGNVEGRVSFDAAQRPLAGNAASPPRAHSLSMYSNPALRNAAATGVQLGRILDAQG